MLVSDIRIVLSDRVLERGSLRIEGDRIVEVVEGPVPDADVDGRGLTAIPGMIDIHGDMLEKEIEPRTSARFPVPLSILELDKRLAGAGVTTAYAALSFHEAQVRNSLRTVERSREIVDCLATLREELLVEHRVHARFEITHPQLGEHIIEMLEQDLVHFVSLMDHTPGQGQYRDLETFIDRLADMRRADRDSVAAHVHQRIAWARENPPDWALVRRVTTTAAARGMPTASHDDDTPEKIDHMVDLGVTISEFPVSLETAQEARQRGMAVAMGAPNVLRGGSHSGNLNAQEAIEAGLVDILASDYYPAAMLHAMFALAERQILPLHAAVNLATRNPALAIGMADRGSIAPGQQADLALIEADPLPRVRGTIRRGKPVYWDSSMIERAERGVRRGA